MSCIVRAKPAVASNKPFSGKPPAAAEDTDDDEEDTDAVGNLVDSEAPVVAPKPVAGKSRRVSVSAESVDPSKMKAMSHQVANIPKSA